MDKRASFTISINQVKRANEELAKGYWFSKATKCFFRSRYAQTATLIGLNAYFVSSEQFHYAGHSEPRKYSVRVCDLATGRIDTVGVFQNYDTSREARAAIREIIKEASQWVRS